MVADAEGFNVHRRQHKSIRIGEGAKVFRSPQVAACRKRHVRELGKPLGFPAGGKVNVGHTDTKARKGKPGNGLCWSLSVHWNFQTGQAEEYCERESPPQAVGVSYQA